MFPLFFWFATPESSHPSPGKTIKKHPRCRQHQRSIAQQRRRHIAERFSAGNNCSHSHLLHYRLMLPLDSPWENTQVDIRRIPEEKYLCPTLFWSEGDQAEIPTTIQQKKKTKFPTKVRLVRVLGKGYLSWLRKKCKTWCFSSNRIRIHRIFFWKCHPKLFVVTALYSEKNHHKICEITTTKRNHKNEFAVLGSFPLDFSSFLVKLVLFFHLKYGNSVFALSALSMGSA